MTGTAPAPVLPRGLNLKKPKLLDCDPLELARQLTLMESTQFLKIRPMECILRSREQRSGKEDNIAKIITTTNQVQLTDNAMDLLAYVTYSCPTGSPTWCCPRMTRNGARLSSSSGLQLLM